MMAQASLWSVLRRERHLRIGMLIANVVGLAICAATQASVFLFVVLLTSTGLVIASHYLERGLRDAARADLPPRKGERVRTTP